MAPNDKSTEEINNNKDNDNPKFPKWLNETFFHNVLEKHVGKGFKVKNFKPIAAFGGGENYASDMLRIEMDLELNDGTETSISYILKMMPQNDVGADVVKKMNLFPKEMQMYGKIIPEFEKLYADIGKSVTFGPKCYSVSNEHGGEIIMEDLKNKNFKNAKRQIGLDITHSKRVLEKMAQFHAASACWFEKYGPYPDLFLNGFYNENVREIFEKMNEVNSKLYIDCMLKYKNGDKYVDKIGKFQDNFIDILIDVSKVDPNNFNVLNHGDLWCNNIMFQYDTEGNNNINEIYFVDYQISKYGSPSSDLYYFIISSTSFETKISEFDFFVKYYHDKLVENLKLLSYPKRIPLLRDIHIQLLKDKFWALGTASGVMSAVLLDPTEDASIENFLEGSDDGIKFKMNAYLNPRYVKTMEALLPFFDNKGLLDFLDKIFSTYSELRFLIMTSQCGKEYHPSPIWLTKDYLEEVFRSYRKSNNLKIKNLEIVPATQKGDNYGSVMTRIKISFNDSKNPNSENTIYNYIVKTSFEENKFASEILKEYKTFECEMNMYENVLPRLTQILRRINKDEYIFAEVIFVDRKHIAIIMEDLSQINYKTADRIERLDLKHTKYALNKMAKMHAASLILHNELGNNYLKSFDRGLFNSHTHHFGTFFKNFTEGCGVVASNMGGEYVIYGEKIKKILPYFMEKVESVIEPNDKYFNTLNHGDYWTNNLMFKYKENGEIENALLIDFQFSKWTSPAWDLHYFINTSVQEEVRHKRQDELFQCYHENLVNILKKLNYVGKVPDLHKFRLEMAEKEFLAFVVTATSQVLLINDQTEDAEFDTLMKTDERSMNFRKVAYSNPRVLEGVKNMLPIYDRTPAKEVLTKKCKSIAGEAQTKKTYSLSMPLNKGFHAAPIWLTKDYLEEVFRSYRKSNNFKIKNLEIVPATQKGDNYASVMTRIKISFNDSKNPNSENTIYNYIVKTSFEENKFASEIFKEYRTFECEMNMYENVLPRLTQILRRINKDEYIFPEVIFVDRKHIAIIMEDLSQMNYKTADRIERLDLKHTKYALNRMAKMHAASLILHNELGNNYLKSFDRGLLNSHAHHFSTFFKNFTEGCGIVASNMGGEYVIYGEKIKKILPYFMEKAETAIEPTDKYFNTLNHGDFWTNNVMFKYKENGEIENALLIDFQFSKWTSPAWDLHYFINTSVQEEIRHKGQDELFQYYHKILVNTLKQLNYDGKIADLYQFRLQVAEKEFLAFAITATSQVILINDKTDDAEFDVLMRTDERSMNFRKVAYSNPRVLEGVKNMLPIYDRRGLLDV
ncbi:uncharacterized protein LOC129612968 [Condylostylus longicornis]|uniref:uncharacterized protein LOC129612968 n=1 Tax=Condylostylus longicornis TaxID=2530218 RepID=UPI00244DDAEA|nr:uncharacterized protein LOC129612968 [Condylostylus longicornis]